MTRFTWIVPVIRPCASGPTTRRATRSPGRFLAGPAPGIQSAVLTRHDGPTSRTARIVSGVLRRGRGGALRASVWELVGTAEVVRNGRLVAERMPGHVAA